MLQNVHHHSASSCASNMPIRSAMLGVTTLVMQVFPAMPLLILGAAASAATAGVLGSTVVIPRMKQLPEQSLQLDTVCQKLLAQVTSFSPLCSMVAARTFCSGHCTPVGNPGHRQARRAAR